MRSRRKTFIILSCLVGFALVGLIAVQVAYLGRAYDRELRVFSSSVNNAMSGIVRKIEAREAWAIVNNMVVADSSGTRERMMTFRLKSGGLLESSRIITTGRIGAGQDSIIVVVDSTHSGHFRETIDVECMDDSLGREANYISIMLVDTASSLIDTTFWSNAIPDSSIGPLPGAPDCLPFLERRYIIEKVLEDMSGRSGANATERIEPEYLDSLVVATLEEFGIDTRCVYGVGFGASDTLAIVSDDFFREDLVETEFRVDLFPHDLVARSDELLLYFPDQSSYLLGREGFFLVLALLSILLLAGCFIYVIRTLWNQKRFSAQLIDFINNMTHEFKTPVSTIAIVGENLGSEQGAIEPERLDNYSRILTQESGRMRRQVEKILEMAALEEGEITLSCSIVDLGELLGKVAEGVSMRIGSSGGTIDASGVEHLMVEGDPVHLANVFHNLIDNGVKYTSGSPHIALSTTIEDEMVIVSVKDDGIGMKSEDLRYIFEKYYRIGTGNLHDVKGFGLGLSYVRLIVESHGGSVDAASSPGKGSTFTVRLPLGHVDRPKEQ